MAGDQVVITLVPAMDPNLSPEFRRALETLTWMGSPSQARPQSFNENAYYQYIPSQIQATSIPPIERQEMGGTRVKPKLIKRVQSKRKRRLYTKEEDDVILDFVYQK